MRVLRSRAHRRAPGHPARGHAGAGDARRHRRADARSTCRSARSWSTRRTASPLDDNTRKALAEAPARDRRPGAGLTAAGIADRRHRARRSPRGCSARRPSTSSGWRWRSDCRDRSRTSTARSTRCPMLSDGIDLGGAVRPGRDDVRAGAGMTARSRRERRLGPAAARRGRARRPPGGPAGTAGRPRQPALRRRRAARRPRAPSIVVCCGSGGVGKTTTAAALGAAGGRARPLGGRAHHRPGPPAGPVARAQPSSTTRPRPVEAGPAPGRGRRQPRRDDAGHEADLRRGRRGARQPRQGASRSWPTRSTWRCPARSPAPRSTWPWRSSASCTPVPTPTALGPDRRRHPTVTLGAGLPGRARAPVVAARRPPDPAADRPGQGAGPAAVARAERGDRRR